MYFSINGPNAYGALTVTTTAQELKVGASVLDERKIAVVQSLGNNLYIGFDNSVTTSTGIQLRARQTFVFECGEAPVWLISDQGAGIDVRIWELG